LWDIKRECETPGAGQIEENRMIINGSIKLSILNQGLIFYGGEASVGMMYE